MGKVDIERRVFRSTMKVETRADGPSRIVGHAAVFNALSENLGGFREMIRPGTFAQAIEQDDIRALFNHDPNMILGRNRAGTLELQEDETGLAVDIELPDTQLARDLVVSIDRGDVSGMSFGFSVRAGGQDFDEDEEGNIVRTLSSVKLFDVSPVTFPAYPQTDVALRHVDTSGFEDFLQQLQSGQDAARVAAFKRKGALRLAESYEFARNRA